MYSIDTGSFLPAQSKEDVSSNFTFFAKSAWVDVAEKSFYWASSLLTCTILDPHFPKSLSENPRTPASRSPSPQPKISSICVASAPTSDPVLRYERQARVKRGGSKATPNSGRRIHGVHQVLVQGPMDSHRGVIQPIGGRPQFPNTARILGIPCTRSTKKDIAIKAIGLEAGILDVKAPRRPLP